jgi:hypothetical protein
MGPNAIIRGRSRKIYALLAATVLLTEVGSMKGGEARADDAKSGVHRQSASSEPLVIQGRITGIQGVFVTVKTPDGYPGGPGVHAQFVIAGPAFKVDVSHARVLLPDGKQVDPRPLAVGDRVLMVLVGSGSDSPAPNGPGNVVHTHVASTIERIADADKMTTH